MSIAVINQQNTVYKRKRLNPNVLPPQKIVAKSPDTPSDEGLNGIHDFSQYNSYKKLELVNKENNFELANLGLRTDHRPALKIFPLNFGYTFDEKWGTLINVKACLHPDDNIINCVLGGFLPHCWIKFPNGHYDIFWDSVTNTSPLEKLLNTYLLYMLKLNAKDKRNKWKRDVLSYLEAHKKRPILLCKRVKAQLHQQHAVEVVNGVKVEDPVYDFLDISVVHPKMIKFLADLFTRRNEVISTVKKSIAEEKFENRINNNEDNQQYSALAEEESDDFFNYDLEETVFVDNKKFFKEAKRKTREENGLLDEDDNNNVSKREMRMLGIDTTDMIEAQVPDKSEKDKLLDAIFAVVAFERSVGERIKICNANIDFINRFMIDKQLKPSVWYEVSNYNIIHTSLVKYYKNGELPDRISTCPIEILLSHKKFIPVDKDKEPFFATHIPNVKVVTFDTESLPLDQKFPSVERGCPMMTAAFVEVDLKSPGNMKKYVLQLKGTKVWDTSVKLFQYSTEKQLVEAMCEIIRDLDPGCIVTHNGNKYDWCVLFEILQKYKIMWTYGPMIGRTIGAMPYVRKSNLVFKGRANDNVYIPDRLNLDLLPRTLEEYKLPSNTLNSLSQHFIGDRKEDLPYWLLEREFNRGSDGRSRIAKYCLKDAVLTVKLLIKLNFMLTFIGWSNMTSMAIQSCLDRSSGTRVVARLQIECFGPKLKNIRLKITIGKAADKLVKKYKGADCLPPKCGAYFLSKSITLDFSGMYPSIMMAYNLDHLTKISMKVIIELDLKKDVDYWQRPKYEIIDLPNGKRKVVEVEDPEGPCFLKAEKKKGLIPCIQEEQKANRNLVKGPQTDKANEEKDKIEAKIKVLSSTSDTSKEIEDEIIKLKEELAAKKFLIKYLDVIQNVIKIFMNSMYGKCGDLTSELCDVDIAETVTLTGKALLMIVRVTTRNEFGTDEGWWFIIFMIYGDTDSVISLLNGVFNVGVAISVGLLITKRCNDEFKHIKPVSIAFEKVVENLIMITGKNYVFMKTEIGKKGKPEAKGIKAQKRSGVPICNKPAKKALDMLVTTGYFFKALMFLRQKRYDIINRKLTILHFIQRQKLGNRIEAYKANAPVLKVVQQIRQHDVNLVPQVGDYVTFAITENQTKIAKVGQKLSVGDVIEWGTQAIKLKKRYNIQYYLQVFENDMFNYFKYPIANFLGIEPPAEVNETKTKILDDDRDLNAVVASSVEHQRFKARILDYIFKDNIETVRNKEMEYYGIPLENADTDPAWKVMNKKAIRIVPSVNASALKSNDPLGKFFNKTTSKCKKCYINDVTSNKMTVEYEPQKFRAFNNPYCESCWNGIYLSSKHSCPTCESLPDECLNKIANDVRHKCSKCKIFSRGLPRQCTDIITIEELHKLSILYEKKFIATKLEWKKAHNICIDCLEGGNRKLIESKKKQREIEATNKNNDKLLEESYDEDYDVEDQKQITDEQGVTLDYVREKYLVGDPFHPDPNNNNLLRLEHMNTTEDLMENVKVCSFYDCDNLRNKYDLTEKLQRRLDKLKNFQTDLKWLKPEYQNHMSW